MPLPPEIIEKKRALDAARPLPGGVVRGLADWFEQELTVAAVLVEKVGLTRDDVLAVLARGRPLRSLPATAQKLVPNHLKALELMARLSYPQSGATSERTVAAFHGVLYRDVDEAAGEYRDGIPDDAADGAPDPAKLRVSMSALSGWLRRTDGGPESAIEAHLRLMMIRPFTQGNAAVALLVGNLMLNRAGYPPIVVDGDAMEEYDRTILRAKTVDDRTAFRQLAFELLGRSLDVCLIGAVRGRGDSLDAAAPFADA
ncbi:Fic family protein [bacterium]|nr:Fic family protein [bacterium]